MKPRKPRKLTSTEEALWRKAMEQTARLALPRAPDMAPETEKPSEQSAQREPSPGRSPVRPFVIGQNAAGQTPQLAKTTRRDEAPSMDHKAWRKMKSGKLAPEARLDLHGYTLAQAQPRLHGFITQSAACGHRLVLVITGKGRGDPNGAPLPVRPGALRHAVPHWLHSAPLGALVLQVSEAHRRHGGQGALYVYLRRGR